MRTRSVARTLLALLFTVVSSAALAAGCGVDNELLGGTCAAGYTQCGLHCVKLAVDPGNCGACGHACQGGSACADGVCDPAIDASADAPRVSDGAADGPARDDGSPRADGSPDTATAEASAIADASSGEPQTEASWDGASIDPAEASADDAAADGGTPADPTDSTGAILGEGGDAGDLDSSSLDPTDATGDDSSTADPNAADSAVVDSAAVDSTPDDSNTTDGPAGEAADPCVSPLVSCGGMCIDVTGDPLNCGGCNVVCASQLCGNATCVGAASGGIVYVGHDYTTTLPGTAQARVLSNAVFVPESNPLHVMSYERYASASGIAHVDAILNDVAHQVGRTLSVVSTTSDDYVRDQLALPNYDVLLVHDQPTAPDGTLAALGAAWASTLATFTLGGGVVVVLDGGGGIGQMPAFATGSALLSVTSHAPTAVGTPLLVTSHVDVIGIGVISPYGAGQSSVSVTTEANGGNVVYVVEVASDAASSAPIVVHKAF